jgi:hypothetical protein
MYEPDLHIETLEAQGEEFSVAALTITYSQWLSVAVKTLPASGTLFIA